MSLRPRYSLLTLLLLTAAVAVGIKLWRGPHHVVDRSNLMYEDEHTYYRDWSGKKRTDGIRIIRYGNLEDSQVIVLTIFRDGVELDLWRRIATGIYTQHATWDYNQEAQLTAFEKESLDAATSQEVRRIQALGLEPVIRDSSNLKLKGTTTFQQ